jgi:hypothetical protein
MANFMTLTHIFSNWQSNVIAASADADSGTDSVYAMRITPIRTGVSSKRPKALSDIQRQRDRPNASIYVLVLFFRIARTAVLASGADSISTLFLSSRYLPAYSLETPPLGEIATIFFLII